MAQYSGWLSAYGDARAVLPGPALRTLPRLDRGPREDFVAISAVYRGSSKAIRTAARSTYDSYLKANRVSEGIDSYDTVLELMLGTTLGSEWKK